MTRAFLFLLVIAACQPAVAHGQIAAAAPIVTTAGTLPDLSSQAGVIAVTDWLLQAAKSRDYLTLVGLAVAIFVALLRWGGPKLHDKIGTFFNSEHGKGILVLATAELATISVAALAHKLEIKTLLDGMVVAFFSAGGYSILKPLLSKIFSGPPVPPVAANPDIKPAA